MKRTFYFFMVLVATGFLLSACSSSIGLTRNNNNHQTEVVLSQKNYKILKYVEGESTARYILGIGGTGKGGMIAKAREKMLKNAGLIGKSRAVINETVEMKTKAVLIYTEVRYIVSAYIIEFYQPGEAEPLVEENVYNEPEEPTEKTVTTTGISMGINIPQFNSYNSYYDFNPKLGYHLGLKAEFSKPNTIKNFFWETQFNLIYMASETTAQSYYSDEKSISVDIPLLIGYNIPITNKLSWYIKGGAALGITFYNENREQESDKFQDISSVHTSGLEAMTGLRINSKFQVGLGHRWTGGGYGNYDFTNISLSYMFK